MTTDKNDTSIDSEFIEIFLEEAEDILAQLEEDLLELEKDPGNPAIIDSVFRSVHTIKGSAGLTGLQNISNFAHVLEDMLDKIRNEKSTLPDSHMMVLLDSFDLLKKMVKALTQGGLEELEERSEEIKELLKFLMDVTPAQEEIQGKDKGKKRYRIKLNFDGNIFATGTDPLLLIEELKEKGEIVKTNVKIADLPDLFNIDPQLLYLSWTIFLDSEESLDSISEVFIFVQDEVVIEEVEPESIEEMADKSLEELLVEEGIVEPRDIENAVKKQKSLGDILVENGKVASGQIENVTKEKAQAKEAQEVRTIRVDTGKLEQILNHVAELAIVQSRIKELVLNTISGNKGDEAKYLFEEINKLTRVLQEEVMGASMIPVGGTFVRFQRMVRDISREKGKEIELIITGKETELDRKVIEQITDPLKHMIRNSVDHGIETPQEREAAGKPRQGKVYLKAYHKEGGIVIEVADDGRGMDKDKILQKAIEKGLVEEGQSLSREEIFRLPFKPGFSTAKEVSDISGRGVGLDVVQSNIQALRGNVELDSQPGFGTKFSIMLPLTMAIIDGMMIRVGEEKFLLPVTSIIEFAKLSSKEVKNVSGKSPVVLVRGEYIPLRFLSRIMGLESSIKDIDDGMVLVVQAQHKRMALLVDEIIGQEQVVIKSVKENFEQVEGVAGATILGDGKVALILDVFALMRMSNNR